MIPLIWFLLVWILFMGVFAVFSILSLLVFVRFGFGAFMTFGISLLFLVVSLYILLLVVSYFLTVDWLQSFDLWQVVQAWYPF